MKQQKSKPTEKQVAAEIAALKEMRPFVRPSSMFGDNHTEAIGAQIVVLEERLSTDAIYDRYQPINEETGEANEDVSSNVLDSALEALNWLEGDTQDKPSDGWKSLDRRNKK